MGRVHGHCAHATGLHCQEEISSQASIFHPDFIDLLDSKRPLLYGEEGVAAGR